MSDWAVREPRLGRQAGFRSRRRLRFAWFLLAAVLMTGSAQAFTVNSTADTDDPTPDGVCDSDPGVPVVCTFREAVREANFVAGPDLINFNIPPAGAKTIILLSILPGITSVVTIDGTTQPGFLGAPVFAPVIELNAAAGGVTGLLLDVGSAGARSGASASTAPKALPFASPGPRTTSSPGTSWARTSRLGAWPRQ